MNDIKGILAESGKWISLAMTQLGSTCNYFISPYLLPLLLPTSWAASSQLLLPLMFTHQHKLLGSHRTDYRYLKELNNKIIQLLSTMYDLSTQTRHWISLVDF